jgi:hypothetical protein
VRRGRRLPLSWGKGRSRAAAKRRKRRDGTYWTPERLLDYAIAHTVAWGARFATYCEMAR